MNFKVYLSLFSDLTVSLDQRTVGGRKKKHYIFSGNANGPQILICSSRSGGWGLSKHTEYIYCLPFPSAYKPMILLKQGSEVAVASIQEEACPAKQPLRPPKSLIMLPFECRSQTLNISLRAASTIIP
jgi:hypothetical protein